MPCLEPRPASLLMSLEQCAPAVATAASAAALHAVQLRRRRLAVMDAIGECGSARRRFGRQRAEGAIRLARRLARAQPAAHDVRNLRQSVRC